MRQHGKDDEIKIGVHRVYLVRVPVWNSRSLGLSEERALAGVLVASSYRTKPDGVLWNRNIYKPDLSKMSQYRHKIIKGRVIVEFPIDDMEIVGTLDE